MVSTNGNYTLLEHLDRIPNEDRNEYYKMGKLIPLLEHLYPPEKLVKIMLTRFSPYFFDCNRYGLVNVRPYGFFSFIYPFSKEIVKDLMYIFQYDYDDNRNVGDYTFHLKVLVDRWKKSWERSQPRLMMNKSGNIIIVEDTRSCATQKFNILTDHESYVHDHCDCIRTKNNLISSTLQNYQNISQKRCVRKHRRT